MPSKHFTKSRTIAFILHDNISDREDDDDGDDDQAHVEGLQFLAEKDMKSLHRVSQHLIRTRRQSLITNMVK